MEMRHSRARWVPLLILVGILAACQPAVTPTANAPAPPQTPTPPEPQASCDDSAITLLNRGGAGIHGAIVADVLHMGGATAAATCSVPVNQSPALAGLPDDRTAQAQQSRYYLIVIRYPEGNRLYVLSRRGDGTSCVVDTNDECVAQVSDLPDDFEVGDLPDDVAPTIPAGRPAPASPEEPAAPEEPVNPGEPGATANAPGTAGSPQPRDGATSVTVDGPLLSWAAGDRATSYELYWGTEENLAADAALGTPVRTTTPAVTIRRPGETATERRLAGETTYYWRVDATNDAGTTTGRVWSFTTDEAPAPAPPAEETGPTVSIADVTVIEGHDFESSIARLTMVFNARSLPKNAVGFRVWVTPGSATACSPPDGLGPSGETCSGADYWSSREAGRDFADLAFFQHDCGRGRDEEGNIVVGVSDHCPHFFSVSIVGDRVKEETETFQVRVGQDPDEDYKITCERCTATVTILDDDSPPEAVSNPNPRDGATGVAVRPFTGYGAEGVRLSWSASATASYAYGLYWGPTREAVAAAGGTMRGVDDDGYKFTTVAEGTATEIWRSGPLGPDGLPGDQLEDQFKPLAGDTTYYWRVDAGNATGWTKGPVWSFTTGEGPGAECPLRACE